MFHTVAEKDSCEGRRDGVYSIQLLTGGASVDVRCANEWMIINPNLHAAWVNYFRGGLFYDSNRVFGPNTGDLQSGRYKRFVDWFIPPVASESHIAVSADCQSCAKPGTAYYMTGNFFGCFYW